MQTVTTLSRRMDRVEAILERLALRSEEADRRMENLIDEMSDFKDEMSDFKNEMSDFKDEMSDFKDEMREMSRKNDEAHREYRREMAQISHKMGKLVEDLVAPSIPRILREVVGCVEEPRLEAVRVRKKLDGRSQEYDAIAICGDYMLINETKSNLQPGDVANFVKSLQEAREFLPDFGRHKIIGALATFYVDESVIVHGERQGLIMLNAGDGLMTVLNSDGFVPKAY